MEETTYFSKTGKSTMRYALVKQQHIEHAARRGRLGGGEFLVGESMHIRRQPDICWMVAETDDSAEAPHSQYAEGYPFKPIARRHC